VNALVERTIRLRAYAHRSAGIDVRLVFDDALPVVHGDGAKLQFFKPMEATNQVEFTLKPQGPQTDVTWTMSGPMPYLSKLMCVFVSMDRMVGPDFEAGLANLKAEAEKNQ